MVTYAEAHIKRVEALFSTVCDPPPFGSLWIVPEEIWKAEVPKVEPSYDTSNNRHMHPGCSLRTVNSTLGPVPMLLGTSRSKGLCARVLGVTNVGKECFFGRVPPVPVALTYWVGKQRVVRAPKPGLDKQEEHALREMCVKKGWL